MELNHIYHLYRRAGFGILPADAAGLVNQSRSEIVQSLFDDSSEITVLDVDLEPFDRFFKEHPQATYNEFKPVFEKHKDLQFPLNKAWLERCCAPSEALNERMTLFWANVFVCKDNIVPYVKQYNETLRFHALGNFKELVKAISKEPAMLRYLNNNQNKKAEPNENFARELMELFTLGLGAYSETDIKEAARAFTGYSHHANGEFVLRNKHHDFGEKEFFGFKGPLDGDDIINIILNEEACARFICQKLYSYLVNEQLDDERVEEMTAVFYQNYEIKEVLKYVFESDWFYESRNIGSKIKSPVDLLSSIHSVVPFRFIEEKQHIFIQRILGQLLFHPPNVAGWQGGKSWIDTNTIMIRLKIPSILLGDGLIPNNGLAAWKVERPFRERIKVKSDWRTFRENLASLDPEMLIDWMLPVCSEVQRNQLLRQANSLSKKDFCLLLMSTPEFQLS